MKKRIILISLIASILGGFGANAEGLDVKKNDSKITVSMNAEPGETVRIAAVKSGYTLSDTDYVYALKEGVADENGVVTVEFYMPEVLNEEPSDGQFVVYGKQNGKEMETLSFWYATAEKRDKLANDFAKKDVSDVISDPENLISLKAAGFAMDIYDSLSAKGQKSVISKVEEEIKNTSDVESVATSFNENIVAVAADTKADVLEEALVFVGAVKDGADNEWILKCLNENSPYDDFEDVKFRIRQAEVLSEIIDARFSELTDLFDKYKKELELSGDGTYSKYLAVKSKNTVNEDIATALESKKPVNDKELISIIKSCLPENSSSGSGGSGGGGGGGYSGGSKSPAGTPVSGTTTSTGTSDEEENKFNDMESAKWAETAVNAMYSKGIISGDGDGSFRPNDSVKREEFVKMIMVAADMHDSSAFCSYTDVGTDSWAQSYIASAVNSGVINGISDTEFGFGQTLTRQDMAVICARVLGKVKEVSSVREDTTFSDEAEIKDYAKESVHTLYSAGMINGMGDGSFAPGAAATRAQAAQMIYNLFVK